MNETVIAAGPQTVSSKTDPADPVDRRRLLRGAGVSGVTGSLLALMAFVLVGAVPCCCR